MKMLALVVLFKVKVDKSDTILSLTKQLDAAALRLFVWDNSPEKATGSERKWLSDIFADSQYHHDGKNTNLSDLYNHIIEHVLRRTPNAYDYLMLFDQDSRLEKDFALKMRSAALQNLDIRLLLPIVRAGAKNEIVSPANLYYFKGTSWKHLQLGLIKSRFTTAINSGMTISVEYLLKEFAGYPPEIPFYGTDNWLCQSVAKMHQWFYVVDTTITHDLAQLGEETKTVKLWRHRQNVRAVRFLNRRGFVRRNLCFIYTFITCVRRAIRYRDLRFLQ